MAFMSPVIMKVSVPRSYEKMVVSRVLGRVLVNNRWRFWLAKLGGNRKT